MQRIIDGIYKGFTVDCEAMGDVGNQIYLTPQLSFQSNLDININKQLNMSSQFVEKCAASDAAPPTRAYDDAIRLDSVITHHSCFTRITRRAHFFGSFEKTTFEAHRVHVHDVHVFGHLERCRRPRCRPAGATRVFRERRAGDRDSETRARKGPSCPPRGRGGRRASTRRSFIRDIDSFIHPSID